MQVVSDNFNTDISLPNGKVSTHSLAINVLQPTCDNHPAPDVAIKRLQRHEISQAILETIGEQSSVWSKESSHVTCAHSITAADFIMHQDLSRRLVAEKDFAFFKYIVT